MEVSFESFSIREYTARMRMVDTSKCWPFGEEARENQLPPIECRRYRWWSTELQIARSGDVCGRGASAPQEQPISCDVETVIPVELPRLTTDAEQPVGCHAVDELPSQASCSKEDEDGEEGGRMARSPGKAKAKAKIPKKRSIQELFAVAPQIDALEDGSGSSDDGKVPAVDKDSGKDTKYDEELRGDSVEVPGKRKEVSEETLMKKIIQKNCTKNKEEEKMMMMKKKKKKKKKKKTKMIMRKKRQMRLLKKQKKQKNNNKIGVAKKEKIGKRRLKSTANFTRVLQDPVIMKSLEKEIGAPDLAQRRKLRTKKILRESKVKAVQASKLEKQFGEPNCFPIQSILRNQKSLTSNGLGKANTTDISQNDDGNHVQQSKHVHFSGKDDVSENHERHFCSLGSTQMQNLCKVFSDVLAASSVIDNPSEDGNLSESNNATPVMTENEDTISDHADNGRTGEHLPTKHPDIQDVSNQDISSEPQDKHAEKKTTLNVLVDLNNPLQDYTDSRSPPLVFKNTNSKLTEGHKVHQFFDDSEKETREIDTDGGPPAGSAGRVAFTDVMRNSGTESGTCSLLTDMVADKTKGWFHPVESHHKDVYTYDSQILKRSMMNTVCSDGSTRQLCHIDQIPESRAKVNPSDMFHSNTPSRNIYGLPLNSQGEYIHFQSSSQFGLNQLFKKQNTAVGHVSSFVMHSSVDPNSTNHTNVKGKFPLSAAYIENQQNCIPEKFSSGGQSTVLPISNFIELQDVSPSELGKMKSVRKYDQFVSNLNIEANLSRTSCHDGFQEQSQTYTHHHKAMVESAGTSEPHFHSRSQPTMRLMGKNFIVGRHENSKEHQGPSGTKIWADKEMLIDFHSSPRVYEDIVPESWHGPEWDTRQPVGNTYENMIQTLETQMKPSANFYQLAVDPGPDNVHLDHRHGVKSLSGSSCHSVSFGDGYSLDSLNHSHEHEGWVIKPRMSKQNHGCETDSLNMVLQSPLAVCNPENVCQHLLLNTTHCKKSQSLYHSMASTFPSSSSIQDADNVKYVQHPSVQDSSQILPHWLLGAGQKRNTRNTSNPSALSFQDPVSKHERCTKSGLSIFHVPSTPISSAHSFPSLSPSSPVCFSDLPGTASLALSSIYRHSPAAKSGSTNGAFYWTMGSSRDGMKSKYSFIERSEYSNNTRKRPAPRSNDHMTAVKRPVLCMQGDSGPLLGTNKGEEMRACADHISKMAGDRSMRKDMANEAARDTVALSTSGFENMMRTRPVKLSAGAKHILKPNQNMDHDKSIPIHSTIPFTRATTPGKVPAPQKKPAKIYQL